MGHATHFLTRLERLDLPEVEIAMAIYRDTAMLRYVLGMCNLPEGAERVAIAMRDEGEGPHLVVTRDGDFVTCLGEGMRPGDLPVVPRGQLNALRGRVDELRVRMAEAEAMAGGISQTGRLLGLLFTEGMGLSREQFRAISIWQPMLRWELMKLLFETNNVLLKLRDASASRQARRHRERYRDIVDGFGRTNWAIGYLTVLVAMGPRSFFDELPGDLWLIRRHYAWPCFRTGMNRLALMAAWAVGKAGKSMLPDFKDAYREARTPQQFICAAASLTAIGLRHQALRAEVAKVLRALPREEEFAAPMQEMDPLRELLAYNLEHAAFGIELTHVLGAEIYVRFAASLPEGHALRYTDPLTVPKALACTALSYAGLDFRREAADRVGLVDALPWLATIEAEELFLPEPLTVDLRGRATMTSMADHLLDNSIAYGIGGHLPKRRSPTPGRNEPCSCGSGVKHKRCCGRS